MIVIRNPNGFGSVIKLSGNRRKPWTARITVSYIDGKIKYKYLGYWKTQAEAMLALAEYNRDPYSLDGSTMTLGELFAQFMAYQQPKVRASTFNGYKSAYSNTRPIHHIKLTDLSVSVLQTYIDSCGKPYSSLRQIKVTLTNVFNYAERRELIKKNYASLLDLDRHKGKAVKAEKRPFSPSEIIALWNMAETDRIAMSAIILIYTGIRESEFLSLRQEDVDLDRQCFQIRQAKTAAGVRTVHIADCVLPLFSSFLDGMVPMTERIFRYQWQKLMDAYGMKHTFHETRHTFISMMAEAGIDERITKSIVGHAGGSITESVYTHINLAPMLEAVNRLPVYHD